ncbi:hypothetical protein BpHYR1_039603, partial [Brachionus plicatilis]
SNYRSRDANKQSAANTGKTSGQSQRGNEYELQLFIFIRKLVLSQQEENAEEFFRPKNLPDHDPSDDERGDQQQTAEGCDPLKLGYIKEENAEEFFGPENLPDHDPSDDEPGDQQQAAEGCEPLELG